jgi:localization factor PodJL
LIFFKIFYRGRPLAERVIRMSLTSPWSVKGVQPKTREAAKDLARREGLTLGEWLNRLIGDVEEEGVIDTPREPRQAGTANPPLTHQGQHEASLSPPSFQTSARKEQPLAPFPSSARDTYPDNENSRLTSALEQLTRRLEETMGQVNPPTAPSPAPAPVYQGQVERSPPAFETENFASSDMMERLEASERRAETALGRVDANLADVRQTQAALAERLRAMEASDPGSKSLVALRGLENALNRLSEQVFETQKNTDILVQNYDGVNQRLDVTEAVAGETRARLAEALVDLSARITGVEQSQDDPRLEGQVNGLTERLAGIEDITTQAIESVDAGLGLVSQRVAATEALAQSTNERLVEALIDLSARLVQLENVDTQEQAREMLSAIEAKNKELTRRLDALDTKIDTTRDELTQEVKTALATGVDSRMADIAKALAERLDNSEKRSSETLERIGAEMTRASISLDQRLREIEDRGNDDIANAMRNEMARMTRSIDERMAAMEQRDAAAQNQTKGHVQELARNLSDRLDASETRAQSAVQTMSSQMEQLAQRLQARQDETAKNLVARMEDGEARSHQELKSSLDQIASEMRASEERSKAVVAPLHADFNSLIDRLDQVEASGIAPYAETVSFGGEAITMTGQDSYLLDPAASGYNSNLGDAFEPLADNQRPQAQPDTRRPSFGSPFPGTAGAAARNDVTSSLNFSAEFDEELAGGSEFDEFAEGPLTDASSSTRDNFVGEDDFGGELDTNWDEASRPNRGKSDYLANARLAASRAAAETASVKPVKKAKPALGSGKKSVKNDAISTRTDASGQTQKSKPILSPVGIVAAAGLVVTTGLIGMNYLSKDKAPEEKPNALKVTAPATPAPAPTIAPEAAQPTPTLPAAETYVPPVTNAAPLAPAPAPSTAIAPKAAPLPAALPAPVPTVRTPPKPSAQAREFQAAENARAARAAARAEAAKVSLTTPVAPRPLPPVEAPRVVATTTPKAVPVPFNVAVRAPNPVVAPTPRPATPQIASVAPGQRPVAAFGTPPATRQTAATNTQTARTSTPRIAAAPSAQTPRVTPANVRQVFDQAIAKQQAGDLAGAAALMRAAADTGDARSIQRLAKMYERGEGVARDPAQARALTERAAARGNSQAMHNLGVYYAEGEGPARDLNKAAESFRRAASRGVTDSQFNLGAMAEQGMGGPRSEREAYYWYAVAAKNGDRDAASKVRELGPRLPAAERAAEDTRAAQFRAEASPGD